MKAYASKIFRNALSNQSFTIPPVRSLIIAKLRIKITGNFSSFFLGGGKNTELLHDSTEAYLCTTQGLNSNFFIFFYLTDRRATVQAQPESGSEFHRGSRGTPPIIWKPLVDCTCNVHVKIWKFRRRPLFPNSGSATGRPPGCHINMSTYKLLLVDMEI